MGGGEYLINLFNRDLTFLSLIIFLGLPIMYVKFTTFLRQEAIKFLNVLRIKRGILPSLINNKIEKSKINLGHEDLSGRGIFLTLPECLLRFCSSLIQ